MRPTSHTVATMLLTALLASAPLAGNRADAAQGKSGSQKAGAKGGDQQEQPKEETSEQKAEEVDTENLFSFTEGSDTGKSGDREILLDTRIRSSKHLGSGPTVAPARHRRGRPFLDPLLVERRDGASWRVHLPRA